MNARSKEFLDGAVAALGDDQLTTIASELMATMKGKGTIDLTLRGNKRAELRVAAKRVLRKCSYPRISRPRPPTP